MSFPRWRTLAGVTLAALGVTAASAQAADPPKPVDMVQNLRVTISPAKSGTSRAPKAASIGVTIQSPTSEPATTETVSVSFGKGVEFNNRAFPTCSLQTINANRSLSKCPRGSIVGKGTARAIGFLNGTRVPETLRVTAVNSPGNTLQLYVAGTNPLPIAAPITGRLVKASGKYGYKLNVRLPQDLQEVIPGTAWAPLVYFHVDVKATTTVRRGGKSTKVPYVQTVKCPSGGWPFEAAFTFDQAAPFIDGPLNAVSPNQKCS
ncbi:hypothetical protein [Conexibacter sp. CPCC 206217]|uniref:hypothetical protein n=1 Tax=Conexibacter sp. CPCC 206217 TaxID=3064574 RepID=UPI00272453AB|nr:hypothetical protein [Conexibacter sp. CPCC 206217]MDO8209193.1 hypothetical protein [Conexibacter sp. CPCC 206217]